MKLDYVNKQILLLIAFCIAAIFLWDTFIIYPIKLFVVVLHELSHGLMAILFGGEIVEIQIDYRIGGYCRSTRPDTFMANFMIASAGYLGSLLGGAVILIIAIRTDWDKYVSLAIGIIMIILSWYVLKAGELFGVSFTLIFGVLMIISYKFLPNTFHDYMLKFIGTISCMYVLIDIKDDLITRSVEGSDATRIAEMTGIPGVVVGVFWLLLAFVIVYYTMKFSFKKFRTKAVEEV